MFWRFALRRHVTTLCKVILLILTASVPAQAQDAAQQRHGSSISSNWPNWPHGLPGDVESVQSIISCYFSVQSGEAKTERDWGRFKSLFLPDGRVVSVKTWNNDPHLIPGVFDLEELTKMLKVNLEKADYEEHPISIKEEESSGIVHVFVHTEVNVPTSTGNLHSNFVYSFQLLKDTDRYWIVEVLQQRAPGPQHSD